MKKLTALMMSLLMLLLCAACTPKEQLTVNVAAMKGPTGKKMDLVPNEQSLPMSQKRKEKYN